MARRNLFDDQELLPLKGQLTVMVPQPEVKYHTNGGLTPPPPGPLGIHMMARSDGIVLGGTSQRGVWTLEPDEDERKRVVDGHIAVFQRDETISGQPIVVAVTRAARRPADFCATTRR